MTKPIRVKIVRLGEAKRLTQGVDLMGVAEIGSPYKRMVG